MTLWYKTINCFQALPAVAVKHIKKYVMQRRVSSIQVGYLATPFVSLPTSQDQVHSLTSSREVQESCVIKAGWDIAVRLVKVDLFG